MKKTLVFNIVILFVALPLLMNAKNDSRDLFCLKNDSVKKENSSVKSLRFENRTELELNAPWGFGLRTINGYKISNHWYLGIGVGFNDQPNQASVNNVFNFYYSTMPVFLDVKYEISRNNHSIYFYTDAGYSILLSSVNKSAQDSTYSVYGMSSEVDVYKTSLTGGFTGSLAIGYSLFVSTKTRWTVSLAYDFIGIQEHDSESRTLYYYNDYRNPYIPPGPPVILSNDSYKEIGSNIALRTGFVF